MAIVDEDEFMSDAAPSSGAPPDADALAGGAPSISAPAVPATAPANIVSEADFMSEAPATITAEVKREIDGLRQRAEVATLAGDMADVQKTMARLKELGATESDPMLKMAQTEGDRAILKARGMLEDVDYETGASAAAKLRLQRADNPREAMLALEGLYGKGNAGQDAGGRWWVLDNGRKVEVFGGGQGMFDTPTRKLLSGMAATAPQSMGALGGLGLGVVAAPFTGGTSILIGPALGAVAGEAADEFVKAAQGFYSKNFGEQAVDAMDTASVETLFALAPPAAKQSAKQFGNWLRESWLGVTDAGREMTHSLLARGARPQVEMVAPDMKASSYKVLMRNLLSGNPQTARNTDFIQGEMRQILRHEGMADNEIDDMLGELTTKSSSIAPTEVGRMLTGRVAGYVEGLQKESQAALDDATKAALGQVKIYETLANQAEPIGREVADAIGKSRGAVGTAFNKVYQHVDDMTGGAPIIHLGRTKMDILDQIEGLPPGAVPAVYTRILQMPDQIPVMQAHAMRSDLRKLGEASNLTPDMAQHRFGELADSVDRAFNEAPNALRGMDPALASQAKTAIDFMRKADRSYGEAIRPYKDAVVNRLVSQMKAGIEPDAAVTADLIMKEGWSERTKAVMGMMQPELRRKVAAADMDMFLNGVRKLGGAGDIRGDAMVKALTEREGIMSELYDPIYGKGFVKSLRKAADDLRALDGKIDVQNMEPGAVRDALARQVEATKQIDSVVKDNFLGALNSRDPSVVDRAYHMLVQPGEEAKLKAAAEFFGPSSPEWREVQKYALKDVLGKAVVEMPSRARSISGTDMDKALKPYTRQQQEMLFPDGLADDLKVLAQEAKFLFPWDTRESGKDMGGSLAAAEIKGKLWTNPVAVYKWANYQIIGWLYDHPGIIRFIAGGLRKGGDDAIYTRGLMGLLGQSVLTEMTTAGPGSEQLTPETPQ